MKSKEIKFSIITPVYNREDCIRRCIESVRDQKYPFVEMWIIDDGSSDSTPAIVDDYKSKYNFIKSHRFESNKGVNAARNYGIRHSEGDFVMFLDSDDYLVDDALNYINEFITNDRFQHTHYLFAQDDMITLYESNPHLVSDTNYIYFSSFLLNQVGGDFTHVMNRDLIQKHLFPENFRIYEIISFLHIFKEAQPLVFNKKIVVNRDRARSDSVTLEYRLSNYDAIKKKFKANMIQLESFVDDYKQYDKEGLYTPKKIKETYLLGLASKNYDLSFLESFINSWGKKIPLSYRIIQLLNYG